MGCKQAEMVIQSNFMGFNRIQSARSTCDLDNCWAAVSKPFWTVTEIGGLILDVRKNAIEAFVVTISKAKYSRFQEWKHAETVKESKVPEQKQEDADDPDSKSNVHLR